MTRYAPALPMGHDEEETRDLHEPRARRYAEALATAAEERIKALTDALAEHEWHRTQAEAMVAYFRERMDLGQQVISGTDDEPDHTVNGLIDITTGGAWVRLQHSNGTPNPNYWVRADASQRGQTQYEWPISDAGPFIVLPDDYALAKVNRDARRRDEQEDTIRQAISQQPAYRTEDETSWSRPDIDVAVLRVVSDLQGRSARAESRVHALERQVRDLEQAAENVHNAPLITLGEQFRRQADPSIDGIWREACDLLDRLITEAIR